jgi:tetratricopeptide (TPR) repeat protein
VVEFAVAARHYPIVFSNSAPHLPVTVCGLQTGSNAFVGNDNRWTQGCYVPAYVRRYPFILMENAEAKQFILCVDEDSDMVGKKGERVLFDDEGKPSELTNRAMELCRAYRGQYESTRRFVEELAEREADAYNLLGFRFRKVKDFDRAERNYRRALRLNPDHKGAIEYYGELFLETNRRDKAEEMLARLEALCPSGCEELDDLRKAFAGGQTSRRSW